MAIDIIHQVVGMEEPAATKFLNAYGLTATVIEKNGTIMTNTLVFCSNRVCLYIKNDKVFCVKRG